jgi:hypothetical protein
MSIYKNVIFFILVGIFFYVLFDEKIADITENRAIDNYIKENYEYLDNITFPKTKIAIITYDNRSTVKYLKLHNMSVDNYAKKHGYTYIYENKYKNSLQLPVYWQKLQFFQDVLATGKYDYVLWLDSDTLITHPEVPLEYLIYFSKNASILIGRDFPNAKTDAFCAGVFMIANNNIGKQFLQDCIDTYINRVICVKYDKKTNKKIYLLTGKWAGECYEQGVMNELINGKYKKDTYEIPQSFVINTTRHVTSSVILHAYAAKKHMLPDLFSKYLNNYVELLPLNRAKQPLNIAIIILPYGNAGIIKKWLDSTGYDIYTCSNELGISNPRLKQISIGSNNKTEYCIKKLFAIYDLNKYDLLFKISGKQFFENLAKQFTYIPNDAEIVIEHKNTPDIANSEIVGCTPNLLSKIVSDEIDIKKYKTYMLLPLKN